MLEQLLKRSYELKAHPEKLGNYLVVRKDVLGIRILGEMVCDRFDEPLKQHSVVSRTLRREVKAKGLKVVDIRDYHPAVRETVYQLWHYRWYRESPAFYADRIVAYRPITRQESERLIRLIRANKEKGIGSGL